MNRKIPLVSVLIPTYNSSRWIIETLESVLLQSYENIEIIVVDDGSSDDTIKILEKYKSKCKIFIQLNSGAGAARNKAFELSRGDYILYLDSDDIICSVHIESLISVLQEKNNDVIAFSQWDRFKINIKEANFGERPTNLSTSGLEWLLIDWECVNMNQCGMFLIPRMHIVKNGGWQAQLSKGPNDDFEFFARLISCASMMLFAPEAKLYYRSGLVASLSRRSNRAAVEAKYESICLGAKHLLAKENSPRVRLACANKFQYFIFDTYPQHNDLVLKASKLVRELALPTIKPEGPPGFKLLKIFIGWRLARKIQFWATTAGLNRASLVGFFKKQPAFK